jgi:6-phosphogluconolactonase
MKPAIAARLLIAGTPEESAQQCYAHVRLALSRALEAQPRAAIAISGGSTPKLLFKELAKAALDWKKIHIFWVDERCVPPDDSQSNFKLANDLLLAPAAVPASNVHRILGELPPEEAAQRYVSEIAEFFSLAKGEIPVFDVLHRGMGPDAHTASLFPGTPLVLDRTGIAAHVWVEKLKMDRVTLLPGVLLAAKETVLQVAGADKAEALAHVLLDPEDFLKYPCQIASRSSRATWFLDRAAAAKL